MRRPRVAVIHPQLRYGGSETGPLWTVEALKRDYDVTLITGGKVDLPRLNAYYGTDLRPGEFSVHEVRLPLGLHRTPQFAGLRGVLFARACRRLAPGFDAITCHYNPCDLGVPLIQFVADFSFAPKLQQALHPSMVAGRRWWYGDTILRRAYLGLCERLAPSPAENWKKNVTVANSQWTAGLLETEFGLIARRVQFPPVPGSFPMVPWDERENGFVCVGRLVPEKRMDAVIGILDQVRQHGFDIHLHILGGLDGSPFARNLQALVSRRRDWVFLEGRVAGKPKRELMARHKFGINGCEREAFGIAVAELVKAGCLTFVPEGGGQTEIVDHPRLTFHNDDDAIHKIVSALGNPALQAALVGHLRERSPELSTERFQDSVRSLVAEFLATKGSQSALARGAWEVGVKEESAQGLRSRGQKGGRVSEGPRVSVVIPAYNAEKTIVNAIQSVLCQTMSDLEVIVVNDASADSTLHQVEAVADPRVRLLQLERNSGPSAARNKGVESARGRWVAFLDADDEWVPDRLERLLEAAQEPECFVADWFAPCRQGPDGRLTPLEIPNLPRQPLAEHYGLTEFLMWRKCAFPIVPRATLRRYGIEFPEWGSGNEWMFWIARLSAARISGKLLHRVGYFYRVTGTHRGLTLRSVREELEVAEFLAADPGLPEVAKDLIKHRLPGIRRQLELGALCDRQWATFARYTRGNPIDLAWLPVSLFLLVWRRLRYRAAPLSARPA